MTRTSSLANALGPAMRTCGAGFAAVILMTTLGGVASGQQVKTEVELLPGGLTFGGPGAVRGLAPGERRTLVSGDLPDPTCVTLVNLGGTAVIIRASLRPQNLFRQVSVRPAHTETFCSRGFTVGTSGFNPTDFEAECSPTVIAPAAAEKPAAAVPGGAATHGVCSFIWRADHPRF